MDKRTPIVKPDTQPPVGAPSGWKQKNKRRRFDAAWKRALVEQALRPDASVAKLARDHDLNTNQLFKWCRQHERSVVQAKEAATLLPMVVDAPTSVAGQTEVPVSRLTVELARGALKFDGPLDAELLRTLVLALSGR